MLEKMITIGKRIVQTLSPNKDLSLADARQIINNHKSENSCGASFDYSSSIICDAFYYGVAIGMKISKGIKQ